MAVRQTGFALLSSASVQEAHDLALVAQAATLRTRVPFLHFFDGFRTSHELNTIEMLSDDDLRALVPEELVREHRARGLSPERPFIRGTAQNPDTYFQARETVNPFYARVPAVVEEMMAALGERTGRRMHIVDYTGHPEAERVVVHHGLRRADRRADGGRAHRARRTGRRDAGAVVPAVSPPRRCWPRCRDRAHDRGAGPHQGTRVDRRAAVPRRRRGVDRGVLPAASARPCRGCAAAATACRRRSSRLRWSPACSTSWPASSRGRGSPSASTTTSPAASIAYDPAFDIESPDTVRAVFFGVGFRRHRRREQEHHQDPRRRGKPVCPGLFRLRLEKVRLPDGFASAVRAASRSGRRIWWRRPTSSAATTRGSSTRPTCSAVPHPARRCC